MPDLSYDQIDALVDVDPIALRDVAWKLTQDVARLEAERDEALRLERQAAHELGLTVAERDEARAELSANERSEDARLAIAEAERDEARVRANEAARLSAEARDQADDLRRLIANLREQVAIIDESRTDMTVVQLRLEDERDGYRAQTERLGANARQLVRLATELRAERDAMRPVVEGVQSLVDYFDGAAAWNGGGLFAGMVSLLRDYRAAVDQTAPSSPQETPHTADGGEAGVVEGAGGSEAAEVYEAAALAYDEAVNAALRNPPGTVLGTGGRAALIANPAFRASIDAVTPLLIAEGRRQAARQIIARDEAEGDWDINVAYWVAVSIAEGTDDA